MRNHISLGPIRIRIGSRHLASWGYPRIQIGGLSIWARTNSGQRNVLAYHPRGSTTWHWYAQVGRGEWHFTADNRKRIAELYAAGNPHAPRPRWWHRFAQRDALRRSQWHDYYRLPFGFTLIIGRQDYHRARAA